MDKYFTKWPENTPIDWWNEGRKQLNVIIDKVNAWTLNGAPVEDAALLLRHIDMGLQTFAAQDGGGGWADELREMQQYISERVDVYNTRLFLPSDNKY